MKIYYDDGECGRLISEIPPCIPFSRAECIPLSEIILAISDYCKKNHIDDPDYGHILIVTK